MPRLVAVILLITSLIFGALDVLVPKSAAITACGTVTAIGGFVLVISAAFILSRKGESSYGRSTTSCVTCRTLPMEPAGGAGKDVGNAL